MRRELFAVVAIICGLVVVAASAEERTRSAIGPFSLVTDAWKVQRCKKDVACTIQVKVRGITKRTCGVSLDNPIVTIDFSSTDISLEWQIPGEQTGRRRFRFQPVTGVDIAGDDRQLDFGDCTAVEPITPASAATFSVPHRRQSKDTAFNYTINVERFDPVSNSWSFCGSLDPIIVNRD